MGDVNISQANEEKTIVPLKISAEICAMNILSLAKGLTKKLNKIPKKFPLIATVSLGPETGIMIINGYVKMGEDVAEFKADIFKNTIDAFKGNNEVMMET